VHVPCISLCTAVYYCCHAPPAGSVLHTMCHWQVRLLTFRVMPCRMQSPPYTLHFMHSRCVFNVAGRQAEARVYLRDKPSTAWQKPACGDQADGLCVSRSELAAGTPTPSTKAAATRLLTNRAQHPGQRLARVYTIGQAAGGPRRGCRRAAQPDSSASSSSASSCTQMRRFSLAHP